jgi:hypothetical protein
MHPCAHSWLDVESIAGSILAVPDRLIVFCPTHASLPPCSPPSKVRPREVGHCGVVCATADLDGVCARRRSKSARSGRRNGYRIEQRNRQECKHLSCQLFMVTIREGDSGRPSPSVLNNPASSPQLPCSGLNLDSQGGILCRQSAPTAISGVKLAAGMKDVSMSWWMSQPEQAFLPRPLQPARALFCVVAMWLLKAQRSSADFR